MESNKRISTVNIEEIKNFLSEKDRDIILDIFEKVQEKYLKKATQIEISNGDRDLISYNTGVADGINHCIKILMGIEDDYLDGI